MPERFKNNISKIFGRQRKNESPETKAQPNTTKTPKNKSPKTKAQENKSPLTQPNFSTTETVQIRQIESGKTIVKEHKKTGYKTFSSGGINFNLIPDEIKIVDKDIIKIADNEYKDKKITKLELVSEILEIIGKNAFADNKLKEITLPRNITKIEEGSFEKNLLTKIKFCNESIKIGYNAFANNKLTEIVIPKYAEIGDGAFIGNPLKTVRLSINNINRLDRIFDKIENIKFTYYPEHVLEENTLTIE